MLLANADGTYRPSYFLIQVDSNEDVSSILSSHEATFVHEYIHLLQDLILPYCIRQNLSQLSEFFQIVDEAMQSRSIRLPVNIRNDDLDAINLQSKYTWGGGEFFDKVTCIIDIESESKSFDGPQGSFDVYKYTVTTDSGLKYHIGARDFLEYIAYKIENKHWPSQAPDLPYNSIDLLFNYMGLSHVCEQVKVCVAEYCLLNDNPMRRLVVLIDDIKKIDLKLLDDYQSCKNFLLKFNWVARGQAPETIENKIERRTLQLKEYLQLKFSIDNFPGIYLWIDSVIDYAKNELNGKLLFSELHGLNVTEFNKKITGILGRIGIPLVLNRNYEIGTSLQTSSGNPEFIQLLMAYEFSNYVKLKYLTCPLCDVCEAGDPNIMNSDCIDAPFRNAFKEELCPFGVFIKSHGLSQVVWYSNGQPIRGV